MKNHAGLCSTHEINRICILFLFLNENEQYMIMLLKKQKHRWFIDHFVSNKYQEKEKKKCLRLTTPTGTADEILLPPSEATLVVF